MMGFALVIALALIGICGWKIFTLEAEWQEVDRERLLLERDRDAFLTYGSELPQMTERRRVLAEDVARLEDRKKWLEEANSKLESLREDLEGKTSRLTGRVAALETQTQENENELGRIRAELERLKPEKDNLSQEVAALKKSEEGLRIDLASKKKQESALVAKVDVLEANRKHLEELLSRMTADKDTYAGFEKNFSALLDKFDGILNRAGATTTDYGLRLTEMEKVAARLNNSFAAIDVDRQNFSANLDAFKKDRQNFAGLLKQSGSQNQIIQAQIDTLQAGNKKLVAAMDSIRGLDSKLQSSLTTETAALRKMAQEDGAIRANLGAAAQHLAQNAQELKTQLERSADAVTQFGKLMGQQRAQLEETAEKLVALQAATEKEKQGAQASLEAGAKLGHNAQALATQAEIFKSRLELADRHSGELEKLLDAQTGRLKDLSGLAKQLADEIRENRRRANLLEGMLAEIQGRLGGQAEAAAQAAPETGDGQ